MTKSKIKGIQAFPAENNDMAYYKTKKPPEKTTFPSPVNLGLGLWDTIKAPLAGLWQGLIPGKNLTFDEYMQRKSRKNQDFIPYARRPRAAESNWLIRTMENDGR